MPTQRLMTRRAPLFMLLLAVSWPFLHGVASAQPDVLPAAGAPFTLQAPGSSGHAWFVAPIPGLPDDTRPLFGLLHVPPRAAPAFTGPGKLKLMLPLASMPEALAAWNNELFFVFPPAPADAKPIRRVSRLSAEITPAGTWAVEPDSGPEPLPSLPPEGGLKGFVACDAGPVALLRSPGGVSLLVLRPKGWVAIELPPGLTPSSADARASAGAPAWMTLVASPDRPGVLWSQPDGVRLAWGELEPQPSDPKAADAVTVRWDLRSLPPLPHLPSLAPPRPAPAVTAPVIGPILNRWAAWVDGQVLISERADDGPLLIKSLRESGVIELARIDGLQGPIGLAPIDGAGRLTAVWSPPLTARTPEAVRTPMIGPPPPPQPRFQELEVSAFTGAELYRGPGRGEHLLGENHIRFFSVALSALMAAVLIFVLRSESDKAPELPAGLALATPPRRFFAAFIDVGVGLILGCWATGSSALAVFSLAALTEPASAFTPVLSGLGFCWVYCSLAEWRTGRTLGKWFMGCGVVASHRAGLLRTDAEAAEAPLTDWGQRVKLGERVVGRPTLGQACIRNGVRLGLAPIAAFLMLIDANWRHPGDIMAGATVVEPIPPEEDEEDEGF